jgi:predicted enzyme related to lactoylglutathione lyase
MQIGNLIEVILYVEDIARAVAFYCDRLGIPVAYPTVPDYGGEMWVVLSTGSCKLCLHGGAEGKRGTDAPKIVFGVADIHQALAALTARGVDLSEVRNPAPGVLVCDGTDPDGNPFSIESAASA